MHDGFSGGAFLDMAGALIGVTTAARIRGLGVVIPAGIAWKTAGAVIEHGRLKRGYIGIAAQRVRLTGDQRPGPDRDAAMLVMAVTGGSPAARAGVLVISDQTVKFHVAAITGVGTPIRVLEAERIPDRDRHLADAHLLRIAERGPGQRSGGSGWQIEPQHREIGPAIVPDDVTAERSAVRQRDPQRPHIADDVAVGEDEPVRVKMKPDPRADPASTLATAGPAMSTAPMTAREYASSRSSSPAGLRSAACMPRSYPG